MTKCNIHIKDRDFHEMHHALGCPWPDDILEKKPYRNFFAAGIDSEVAGRMCASPYWTDGVEKFDLTYFSVTDAGKRALKDHILQNIEIEARYAVGFGGDHDMVVSAPTRSAAKYQAYLECDPDIPFGEFVSDIKSVRLYSRAYIPEVVRDDDKIENQMDMKS